MKVFNVHFTEFQCKRCGVKGTQGIYDAKLGHICRPCVLDLMIGLERPPSIVTLGKGKLKIQSIQGVFQLDHQTWKRCD